MKKFFALMLAFAVLFGMAAFSQTVAAEEKPVVTVLTHNTSDYETRLGVLALQENTGVTLQFQYIGKDTAKEKFNIMVQSDSLPDVIIEMTTYASNSEIYRLGLEEVLLPLNAYLENCPNILANWESMPLLRTAVTAPDGNIYVLPAYYDGLGQNVRSHMYVEQNWLDNLGLAMPTSLDELYDVLVAFRDQDANGNGDPNDEIPLMTWESDAASSLMNTLVMGAFTKLSVGDDRIAENGVVSYIPATDAYRDGLKYIAKLYAEGLLYSEVFSIDRNTIWTLAETDENVNVIGMIPSHHAHITCNWSSMRWEDYSVVSALSGGNDVQSLPYDPDMNIQAKVSLSYGCQNPEAAMKVMDYLNTNEGMWLTFIGVEDHDWRAPKEGATDLEGNPALFETITAAELPEGFLSGLINHGWPTIQTGDIYRGAVDLSAGFTDYGQKFTSAFYHSLYDSNLYPASDYWMSNIYFSTDSLSELALIETDLKNAVKLAEAEFVMGVRDLDADWDAYIAQLESIGLARYLEISQTEYDANYKS